MNCPNCQKHIGRFELSPNCKNCGVNIFYAQQKGLLSEDAKKCELEYATFHILISKLKTAFIGGKIQIMRIVAMVLAIGAIFVPFATLEASFCTFSTKFSFGAFGVYQAFSDGTLAAVFNMNSYIPELTLAVLMMLAFIILIFICGLGVFLTLLLSFINIQKTAKTAQVFSLAGMLICLLSAAESFLLSRIIGDVAFVQAKAGIGSIVCFSVLLLIFVLNRLIVIKNIQPEIKAVDLERVRIRKRIENGEISYDDLSLPVLESEEEKEKRFQENEEKNKLVQSAKEGGQK